MQWLYAGHCVEAVVASGLRLQDETSGLGKKRRHAFQIYQSCKVQVALLLTESLLIKRSIQPVEAVHNRDLSLDCDARKSAGQRTSFRSEIDRKISMNEATLE